MSLDAHIHYKDPARETWSHPFCNQSTLNEFWWPIAKKHGLELLQQMECLFVRERSIAQEMVREFRFVEGLLRGPERAGLSQEDAEIVLKRLQITLDAFEGALAEWENVDYTSI
jgi:hypothetical protein